MNEQSFYKPDLKSETNPTERDLFDALMKQKLATVFGAYQTGKERVSALIEINADIFAMIDDRSALEARLLRCADIEDKARFVDEAFEAMRLALDIVFKNRGISAATEVTRRVQVNELLSFDMTGKILDVHVFSGGEAGKMSKFVEGLHQVAAVLEEHPEIQVVQAFSWIVIQRPRILERLGFSIAKNEKGEVLTETDEDGIEFGRATISREDFLTKYLKKK